MITRHRGVEGKPVNLSGIEPVALEHGEHNVKPAASECE
jgi:hypothetical protein